MPQGQPWVEVDELRAKIDAHRPFTPELIERMQRWLVPQYLWASDALGGKETLSLAEVTAFVESEVCGGGHPLERFLQLQRHGRALQLAQQRAREGGLIDEQFLRDLHRTLFAGAKDVERPGEWKVQESPPTRRRGRVFRYALPAEVPGLIQGLLAEYAQRRQTDQPLKAVAWLYYHFLSIHPFGHGNGQVARLLATTALLNQGYPPLVLGAKDPGPYLDALAACDATVPVREAAPLSPKIEVSPLLDLFCEALQRVATRLLAFVEGKEVGAGELPEQVIASQEALLGAMLGQKDLSWRVRGSLEVRALHERLVRTARQIACKGPLYSIEVEGVDVVRTHAVWREFSASLPAGDAGIVGQLEVVIKGDPDTNLRFNEAPRLRSVVTCSQHGAQLLREPRPAAQRRVARRGPRQAPLQGDRRPPAEVRDARRRRQPVGRVAAEDRGAARGAAGPPAAQAAPRDPGLRRRPLPDGVGPAPALRAAHRADARRRRPEDAVEAGRRAFAAAERPPGAAEARRPQPLRAADLLLIGRTSSLRAREGIAGRVSPRWPIDVTRAARSERAG
jgi:hypothetical protein